MPQTATGIPFSETGRFTDLRDTDRLPVLRLDAPNPEDQNGTVAVSVVKAAVAAGNGTTPPPAPAYVLPGPNNRPDLAKKVTYYNSGTPGYETGKGLFDLNPQFLCLGATAVVEFGPGPNDYQKVFRLVYAPGGPVTAYSDGAFRAGDLNPAQWVLDTAPAATFPAYGAIAAGFAFPVGFGMRSYAGGLVELFFKRKAPGGPAADVTNAAGDANWEKIGERDISPAPNAVYVTRADFVQLLADQQLGPYAGKLLVITTRTNGIGNHLNVWLPVLAEDALGTEDAYTVDYGSGTTVVTPVRYVIATDEVIRRPTGGVTPWAAGQAIPPGQLVANQYGIVCYPASPAGITNPQVEPFLLTSSAQANSKYVRLAEPLGIDYANEQLYTSQIGTPGVRANVNPSVALSFTGSPGVFYLAFPAAPAAFAGAAVAVRNEDPTNAMTLDFAGNGTVDGANTLVLAPGEWRVLGVRGDVPTAQRRAYKTVHKGNNLGVFRSDVDVSASAAYGLVMRSPDGVRWRLTVNDSGLLSGVAI